MTVATGRTTRVIGWYHSHPHITVLPSHVDVRTQAMYQLLDPGFIGLIFSCFSEDAHKVGRIQVIAFQSLDGKQNHIVRPVSVSPIAKSSVIELDSSSSDNTLARPGLAEQDTGDSRAITKASKAGGKSLDLEGFLNHPTTRAGQTHPPTISAIVDIDPMEMTESMQEAMHRSNLEMSGAEFVRKEIPLYLLPTPSILNLESPLGSFADLQRVLYEEEKTAYNQSIVQNMRDGKVHPITFVHHTSTYQASMCKLMEYCLSPAINALQDRLREHEHQLKLLADEAKTLETEALREPNSVSPRNMSAQSPRGTASSSHRDKDLYPSEFSNAKNIGSPGSRIRKGS